MKKEIIKDNHTHTYTYIYFLSSKGIEKLVDFGTKVKKINRIDTYELEKVNDPMICDSRVF